MPTRARLIMIGLYLLFPLAVLAQAPQTVVVVPSTAPVVVTLPVVVPVVVTPPAAVVVVTPGIGEDAPAPVGATIVLTPEASAQLSMVDRARADQNKAKANKMFREGRYKEAVAHFERAYEVTKDHNLLYSVAVSYQQLESWQECVTYMERFLEHAAVGPKKDRAENMRKSCDARIERDQQLIIDSDPPGARVFVDRKEKGVQGTTPFRNYLRPGAHRIWVELDGYTTVEQQIEVQKAEPFRMNLVMSREQNQGWLHVDCSVIDAHVYIDGKNIGLTPFKEPLSYPAGVHQIVVERPGYTRFSTQMAVRKGRVTTVDAHLVLTHQVNTWRTPLGWTANIIGIVAIAGGVVAWQLSEDKYNDTDDFKTLADYERLGYQAGGGLLAVGMTLVIWDKVRDSINADHINPRYRDKVKAPKSGLHSTKVGVGPGGLTFGFTF